MTIPRSLVCLCMLVLAAAARATDANAVFAREIKTGADTCEFKYRLKLPDLTNSAKLWIPAARSDQSQTVETTPPTSPGLKAITERGHGNQILFTELKPDQSGKTIEAAYQVTRKEKAPYPTADDPAPYLKPDRLVPINEIFASLARSATARKTTIMDKARALYAHTRTPMTLE